MINFFNGPRYTEDELMARLKFFIGVTLGLTLFGIVFVVLYSLVFVAQPMNGISPVDNKFFELIVPIATFLTGTLSGIMLAGRSKEEVDATLSLMKQAQENAEAAAKHSHKTLVTTKHEPTFSGDFGAPQLAQVRFIGGKAAPPVPDFPEI